MSKNKQLDEWATAAFVTARLLHGTLVSQSQFHPGILVQQAMKNVFAPARLSERYSAEQPIFAPQSPDEDPQVPIDQVLGKYDDRKRLITIYVKNIARFAKKLQCTEAELLYVVRLHEYAHALDHMGLPFDEADAYLSETLSQTNNRVPSGSRGTRQYRSAGEQEHEFWAQSMTWVAIQALSPTPSELSSAYLELMRHQPPEYQLEWELLTVLTPDNLRALRKIWIDRFPPLPPNASAREALETLLRMIGAEVLQHLEKLRNSLGDLSASVSPSTIRIPASREPTAFELLIARDGPLQVRMYKEADTHRLPHFHLYRRGGHSATYAIEDCRRLVGNMPSKYEKSICKWAQGHKDVLLQAWHDINEGRAPERLVLVG